MLHTLLWLVVTVLLPSVVFGWKLGKALGHTWEPLTRALLKRIAREFSFPFVLLLMWSVIMCGLWNPPIALTVAGALLADFLAVVFVLGGLLLQRLDQREEEEKFLHGSD